MKSTAKELRLNVRYEYEAEIEMIDLNITESPQYSHHLCDDVDGDMHRKLIDREAWSEHLAHLYSGEKAPAHIATSLGV